MSCFLLKEPTPVARLHQGPDATLSRRTWVTACGQGSSMRRRPPSSRRSSCLQRCSAGGGFALLPPRWGGQPDQLPLRICMATRHGHRGGRAVSLRDDGGCSEAGVRVARCGCPSGRASARAFQWARSCRARISGGVPDLLLTPGVGRCISAVVFADHPAPRSVGPIRQDMVGSFASDGIHYLKVEGIPLAGSRMTVEIEGGDVEVTSLPADVELILAPRHATTAV